MIERIDAEETYPEAMASLVVLYKSMDAMLADAEYAVEVTVDRLEVKNPDFFPQTHTFVTVNDVIFGSVSVGDRLEVVEEGGIDGIIYGNIPEMNRDSRYILFLYASKSHPGIYRVAG